MTGLALVMTNTYNIPGLEGAAVTSAAFQAGLPFVPPEVVSFILMICLALFGFTTILGWSYYGERCLEYFSNRNLKAVKIYRWLYIACIFIGPYMTVSAVWTIADIFNACMAVPNMIAVLALSGVTAKEARNYLKRRMQVAMKARWLLVPMIPKTGKPLRQLPTNSWKKPLLGSFGNSRIATFLVLCFVGRVPNAAFCRLMHVLKVKNENWHILTSREY